MSCDAEDVTFLFRKFWLLNRAFRFLSRTFCLWVASQLAVKLRHVFGSWIGLFGFYIGHSRVWNESFSLLKQVVLIVEAVDDPYYFHSFHSRHSLGFSASRLVRSRLLGFSASRFLGFSVCFVLPYFSAYRFLGFSACFVLLGFSVCPIVSRLLGFSASGRISGPLLPVLWESGDRGEALDQKGVDEEGKGTSFFPQRLNPLLKCSKSSTSPATQNKRKSSSHSKWRTQVVWCYLSCDLKSPNFVPLLVCTCAIFVVVPWVNQHCCLLITPAVLWAARRVWPTTPCFPNRLAAVARNTVYTHVTTK